MYSWCFEAKCAYPRDITHVIVYTEVYVMEEQRGTVYHLIMNSFKLFLLPKLPFTITLYFSHSLFCIIVISYISFLCENNYHLMMNSSKLFLLYCIFHFCVKIIICLSACLGTDPLSCITLTAVVSCIRT